MYTIIFRKEVNTLTLNERIKELRKLRRLSQKEFAETIGISQRSVSWGEQPGNNVPDNTIKNICMTFGINEDWLRNGIEPMYIQEPTFSLDKFVKDHGGTDLELEAMKAYFELDPDIRKMLVKHFKERLTTVRNKPMEPTTTIEQPAELTATAEEPTESIMTVEEAEAAYKKSRSKRVQKTVQSASNTFADTIKDLEKNINIKVSNQ